MLTKKTKSLIQEIIENSFERFKGSLAKPAIVRGYLFALKDHPAHLKVSDAYVHANATSSLRDTLDRSTITSLEDTTASHIDALKQKSVTDMVRLIDEHLTEAKTKSKLQGQDLGSFLKTDEGKKILGKIEDSLQEQKKKIDQGLDLIADAEIHTAQNHGVTDAIIGMAQSMNIDDPIVFKIGVLDDKRCPVCWKLWTMPDKITPKVYKLSELAGGFSSAKNPIATIGLSHPKCRDVMTFLAPGFGFDNGKLTYKGKDHDEYKIQRG